MNKLSSWRDLMKRGEILVALLFLAYLGLGWAILDDFSFNWDEEQNRRIGLTNLENARQFINHQPPSERIDNFSDHGAAFELVLVLSEKFFGYQHPRDTRQIFLMRHRLTFLLFAASVFVFYLLCRKLFGSWQHGLVGALLLVLHPRIFSHSFHNASDIAFLAAFIFAMYTLCHLLSRRKMGWAIAHGFTCALAMDIRIVGCLLIAMTLATLILLDKTTWRTILKLSIAYIISVTIVAILLWPFLWAAPRENFFWALRSMSRIPWHHLILYGGQFYSSQNLPWHYNLGWIAVTTPPVILFVFLVGVFFSLRKYWRKPFSFFRLNLFNLAVAAWLIIPLLAPIALKSVLFDEWRHHYFIYPAIVIYGVTGLDKIIQLLKAQLPRLSPRIIIVAGALALSHLLWLLISGHPNQHIYFNVLSGKQSGISRRYEMDYWGLTQREGLRYVAKLEENNNRRFGNLCGFSRLIEKALRVS